MLEIKFFGQFNERNDFILPSKTIHGPMCPITLDVPEASSASKPEPLQDVKAETIPSSGSVDLPETKGKNQARNFDS